MTGETKPSTPLPPDNFNASPSYHQSLTPRDLERELNITGKAGQAVRGATEVVKKVDSDLKVTERARGAANRALTAAQKADKELRVRERAAGAAKTAEKVSVSVCVRVIVSISVSLPCLF